MPVFPQTQANQANVKRLEELAEELAVNVGRSTRRCCLFRYGDVLFGRSDQAKLILKETFEGTQFFVQGPDGNKIDAMFFPCTNKETVKIDWGTEKGKGKSDSQAVHNSRVQSDSE